VRIIQCTRVDGVPATITTNLARLGDYWRASGDMAKAESDFAPVCGRSAGLRYNRSGRQSGLVSGAVFKTVRRLLRPLVCSIRTVFRQFIHQRPGRRQHASGISSIRVSIRQY
jgi:hypothetical protein